MGVRFDVLGDLRVTRDGQVVDVPRGLATRTLLCLLVDFDRGANDDVLVDLLWPKGAPPNSAFSLRNQITTLRKLLGRDVILRTTHGYRLDPAHCTVDVHEFDRAMKAARADLAAEHIADAVKQVTQALALRRGPPFVDVRDDARAESRVLELDEHLMLAEELWADAQLRCRHVGRELPRLRRAALAHPDREIRWQQLIEAATVCGRGTEALRARPGGTRRSSGVRRSPRTSAPLSGTRCTRRD